MDNTNTNPVVVSGLYRLAKMRELLGVGNTTIWELSRHDPDFPKPIKITNRCTAWRADEVHAWINSRPHVARRGGAKNA